MILVFYIAQVLLQDAATIIIHNYCLFSQSSFQRARLALERAAGKENGSALAWRCDEMDGEVIEKTYNTNRKVDNWMIFNSSVLFVSINRSVSYPRLFLVG
jgi:hypothetical protein